MIIGGAEDKLRKRTILKDFVAASGGADARIAVIPTASSLGDEVVEVYDALFRRLGAGRGRRGAAREPRGGARPRRWSSRLDERHRHLHDRRQPAQALRDHLRHAARRRHRRAPTSAARSSPARRPAPASSPATWSPSASAGPTPKQRMTQVAAGLGLLGSTVIDQHFDQRNRYGRLLMIVAQSPAAARDRRRRGHLPRSSTRRRPRGAAAWSAGARSRSSTPPDIVTNAYEAKRSSPLLASGVVLHVLPAGRARST